MQITEVGSNAMTWCRHFRWICFFLYDNHFCKAKKGIPYNKLHYQGTHWKDRNNRNVTALVEASRWKCWVKTG